MRVSIVQHDIVWGQPAENVRRLTQMLDQQSGADLYVLSETFATGFMADEAIPQEPNLLAWLQAQALEKDAAFAASIAASAFSIFSSRVIILLAIATPKVV